MSNYYRVANEICIHADNVQRSIADWVIDNLTFDNPEYTKKARLGKYLGATPKEIELYRVSYDRNGDQLVYIPYGMLNRFEKYIAATSQNYTKISDFKGGAKLTYPDTIPLRVYQQKAVVGMINAHGGVLQAPAGSGKTQIGLSIVATLGKKTLWLTHTKDLLNQSKARAEEYWGSTLIGTITEGKVNVGKGITFATVQTMAKLDLALYRDEWEVIIVDECHNVSGSATKVKLFQKVLENLATPYQYGLSATIHRADGLVGTMFALIGDLAYTISEEEVRDYITPVSVLFCHTGVKDNMSYLNYDGTIDFNSLINTLVSDKNRNQCIINQLLYNRFNSNLILSDRLDHLHTLYDMLPFDYKQKANVIDGTTKKSIREQAIEDMRTGKKNYLFATYKLAKEGLDIPCLDRLYLATPQKDYAIVVQSIGRIARKCDSKANPIVYDFVDDIDFLKGFQRKRLAHYRKEGCKIYEKVQRNDT